MTLIDEQRRCGRFEFFILNLYSSSGDHTCAEKSLYVHLAPHVLPKPVCARHSHHSTLSIIYINRRAPSTFRQNVPPTRHFPMVADGNLRSFPIVEIADDINCRSVRCPFPEKPVTFYLMQTKRDSLWQIPINWHYCLPILFHGVHNRNVLGAHRNKAQARIVLNNFEWLHKYNEIRVLFLQSIFSKNRWQYLVHGHLRERKS